VKKANLIIGAGGAGRSLASALRSQIDADVLLINAASAWQVRPPEFPSIALAAGSGERSFHSVRHARAAMIAAKSELEEAMEGRATIIIAAGLGGNTGSAVAPFVAEVAAERGITTVAGVATPFEFEGERVFAACGALRDVRKHCPTVCVYDHQRSLQTQGSSSLTEALDFAAMVVASEVTSRLEAMSAGAATR
jgi:cell division GTPase FtsZ